MDADVHQGVDRGHEEERHEEPIELAGRLTEPPVALHHGDEREGHVQTSTQKVCQGQAAQEEVRSRPHAAVTRYDDDDHAVANNGEQHKER